MNIRRAGGDDAEAMLRIYAPIVEQTTTSFELVTPSVDEFRGRVERSVATHDWLVAEEDGVILGYAYGTPHRSRAAYRFSAETSVYVAEEARGRGLGSRLYERLFASLANRGYYQAFAGVTLPNPASEALHCKVGFRRIGQFPSIGFKYGNWHDVAWFYRPLRDGKPDEG